MPRPFIWPLALDPLVAAHDPVGTLGAAVSEVAASAAGTAQANKSSRFHGCAREPHAVAGAGPAVTLRVGV